ncbi:MAG: tail fiber domain-containing protein [Phycisphaerales bacterium]|nr:tail fiber domain-containing protein [Phycisphaerales bacterium]
MRELIRLLLVCTTMTSAALAGEPIPAFHVSPDSLIGSFEDRSALSTYQYDAPPYGGWLGPNGEYVGVNAFTALGGGDLLTSISCVWRGVANGSTQRVFVWQDDGSGNFRSARLVAQQGVTVANTNTATVNMYSLANPVPVSGRFYVGFSSIYTGGSEVLAFQGVGGSAYVPGRSYFGVSATPFDAANLGAMLLPFTDVLAMSTPSYFAIRASGSGSSFIYQGRLTSSGTNYSGPADFRLTIFDRKTDGVAVSPVVEQRNVNVTGGVFSLQIPSDPSAFVNAPDRYLQVEVRTPAGSGDFTPLTPRERIGQVPAAMVATQAQNVPWSGVSGVPTSITAWDSVQGGIGYSDGRVGIGTATPTATLDVNGSIATSGPILFGNRLDDLLILNGAPGGPNFGLGIAPSTLRIHTAVSSQIISFGFGSAAAYTQTASISGAGNLTIIGNGFKPGGGSWAVSCDPRLKHDIAPLAGTLDRLLSLRGYRFVYNDDAVRSNKGLPGVQIGLMADEVERVFPDWVSRDKDGMRMVTERSTTALMVEALRDLRAEKDGQIAELKSRLERVEHLEKENTLLRERLEKIEKALAR